MRLRSFLPLLPLLLAPAISAKAQEAPPLVVEVSELGHLGFRVGDVLGDGGLRRAVESGIPLRLRVSAELWRDGVFDEQVGGAEWRASVVLEPLDGTWRIETSRLPERVFATREAAARYLSRPLEVDLGPEDPGRYYWLAELSVETLSLSDLEELQRWLRGDLGPAVSGERDIENAVERGVRRLFVRVLGLPARRFRVRSDAFEWPRAEGRP